MLKDMPDTKVPLLASVAMVKLLVSDSHANVSVSPTALLAVRPVSVLVQPVTTLIAASI
jgi:hypothetical protein